MVIQVHFLNFFVIYIYTYMYFQVLWNRITQKKQLRVKLFVYTKLIVQVLFSCEKKISTFFIQTNAEVYVLAINDEHPFSFVFICFKTVFSILFTTQVKIYASTSNKNRLVAAISARFSCNYMLYNAGLHQMLYSQLTQRQHDKLRTSILCLFLV